VNSQADLLVKPAAGQGSAIPDNLNKSIKIYFNPNSDKDLFV
jgi:hypothetical protein